LEEREGLGFQGLEEDSKLVWLVVEVEVWVDDLASLE
jgi:hypothetical protein